MQPEGLRNSGIRLLGRVAWGAHVCLFFSSKEESLEILVPYFAEGLRDNEFCMWITSSPLSVEDAKLALKEAVPDLESRIGAGQIEILDSSDWYTKQGKFHSQTTMNGWTQKLQSATERGYAGLRLCGFTTWLEDEDWDAFIKYEDEVGDLIERSNVIAMCSYALSKCDAPRLMDVVSNHHYALIKKSGKWTLIENTERAKAIKETRETEQKYRRTADNIGVAMYSALPDETSTTVLVTDKISQITGYSADEFYRDPSLFEKMVHPDDAAMVWEKIRQHREKRAMLDLNYRIIRKDGKVRWVKDMAYPSLNESGEIERIDGFMEDVTEMRWTEEALKNSQERFALAQKAARIGSWDWNIRSGMLEWSEEIEPMFGFGPGQFEKTYEAFLRCVHPEDRQKVQDAVKECVERGSEYELEHRIVLPDGSIRWISEKGNVIRDESEKAVRMLGVAQDVTKSKLAEQRIGALIKELTTVNDDLEAFCYAVSHDLRAPLRRIEGFGNLLLEDTKGKLEEGDMDYLKRIIASSTNMDQLIDDFLKLSRTYTVEVSTEDVNLAALSREVADQLAKLEPDRNVSFAVAGPMNVRGDRVLLRSVLENLIGNAWKFTRGKNAPQIEFGVNVADEGRVFYVKDNGAGFDPTRANKLFKPSQRLHSESEFPGNGLGLAVVKKIVERHGGRVWADGEVGQGATFYFTLADQPVSLT